MYLTLARGRGSTARGAAGGPARREGEGGRGEGRRPRARSAPAGPGQRRGREGPLSPQPPGPGPRRDPLTLARGSGSTARGGRGGPCQTGGRGRAGGRPEAEGPQRPARPRQRRGREGRLSPQPPGPGPRRDPLTPGRGPGRRARTFSKPLAPVHVAAWRAVRGPFVPVLRHVVRVQVRVAARAQRLVHVHKMAPCALVPKNGHAATAPVQHQAGRHAVHEAKRAEDRPIGVAQAPRPEEATYQPGPQRRRARQLLQRRPRVARPPAPAAALSCRAVRRPPAGGRGHDAVLSPFPSHFIYIFIYIYLYIYIYIYIYIYVYIYIYIYIYTRRPFSPPFAPLYAPRQSTASFVIGPQHARLRKVNAEIMFFAGRKTEEAEIAVLVALVIGGGGGGPCYRWWWPLLSVVVALVIGGPCCRWPLLVVAVVVGGGGGWWPLLVLVVGGGPWVVAATRCPLHKLLLVFV